MAIEFVDPIKPFGADFEGALRLVRGKDLDITDAASALTALADADIFLVDDAAAGTQTSTKKITAANMKLFMGDNKSTRYVQSGVPNGASATPPVKKGDFWIDTDDDQLYIALADDSDQVTSGEWTAVAITDTTYSEATSSDAGLMSTAHHDKLDGIAAGAQVNRTLDAIPFDGNALNSVSSNGVYDALATKLNLTGGTLTGETTIDANVKLAFGSASHFIRSNDTDLSIGTGGDFELTAQGGDVIISDTASGEPKVKIHSKGDNEYGGTLTFLKDRAGDGSTANVADDNPGKIVFSGYNNASTPALKKFADMAVLAKSITENSEYGKFSIQVLTSAASGGSDLQEGFYLQGHSSTNDLVDVILGSGSLSTTHVIGQLRIGGSKIATDGNFEIQTNGHFVLDSGNDITLDSNSGNFIMSKAGTEFSPANSSYAGMVLGYSYIHPSTLTYHTLATSLTVEDSGHNIVFKTPPSEKVEIEVVASIDRNSTSDVGIYIALSSDSTYTQIDNEFDYDFSYGISASDDEADDGNIIAKFVLQAGELEAIGASNTIYIAFGCTDATAATLRYGHAGGRTYHPFIIKATALPASIGTG